MQKTKIVFHILMKNKYEEGLIQQTIHSLDNYDVSLIPAAPDCLELNHEGFDILVAEPSLTHWDWLDAAIRYSREYPELFIILYSRELIIHNAFESLSGPTNVFLVNDVTGLKDNLPSIIAEAKKKQEPKKNILFVDDEPSLLNSYKRMLRKSPWNVVTASSAEKALETLHTDSIDLVITDMKMPKMHGMELISKIREDFKTLPIFVCSAYHRMRDDQELRFQEIAEFIEKPVDDSLLKEKIQRILDLHAAESK